MLLKKPGISRIQLPWSMRKAPRSKTCKHSCVAVIINRKFPSIENKDMGRFLDPEKTAPKSWREEKDRIPLSPMYQRMLIGYGVKESDVKEYKERSKHVDGLRHGKC